MRRRTAALAFVGAAAAGAATIGAAVAVVLAEASADRLERACTAMAGALLTRPLDEDPPVDGHRPRPVVLQGGPGEPARR